MKKIIFFCISCMMLTLASCGDEEPENTKVLTYNNCTIQGQDIPVEGGTAKITWLGFIGINDFSKSFTYKTSTWSYQGGGTHKFMDGLGDELDVTTEDKTVIGEWFKITPLIISGVMMGNGDEACRSITVEVAPNTTGQRRALRVEHSDPFTDGTCIFQDCEETEE